VRRRKNNWILHLVLTACCLAAIFPIIWVLSTSFKPEPEVFSDRLNLISEHTTLDNYRHVLTMKDGVFFIWLRNSTIIALITTVIGVFLAATAAYAFSRFRFLGRQGGLYIFLIAQMFPGAILIVPLYNLMRQFGMLNSFAGLILAYSTVSLPFCVWMLKGFFDTIPRGPCPAWP
jgi:arabinogalactan oligomer/maltooligosaccharide transport system permease protein